MSERKLFDLNRHLPSVTFVAIVALVVAAFLGIFVYVGVYDIGADAPHSKPVTWALAQLRSRSIAVRAQGVAPPGDLNDPKRFAAGAGLYAEMCSSCHLAPGMEKSEISQGLYPQAPELSQGVPLSPGEEFWVIKHGVKLTAMPAWGRTHSDDLIWDMVAFVRKLPSLSAEQYEAAVKSAPEDHEEMMREMNGGPMPGMSMPGGNPHHH